MKYLLIGIIGLAMTGCVTSLSNSRATYEVGYEERDNAEDRYTVEPGIEADLGNGGTAGVSYRYREEENDGAKEHGVFVKGSIPLSKQEL